MAARVVGAAPGFLLRGANAVRIAAVAAFCVARRCGASLKRKRSRISTEPCSSRLPRPTVLFAARLPSVVQSSAGLVAAGRPPRSAAPFSEQLLPGHHDAHVLVHRARPGAEHHGRAGRGRTWGTRRFTLIGAYTYAILSTAFGVSFWPGILAGALTAAFFAVLVGAPTLRLRGDYFAIVTLGLGEITRIVFNNWDSVTGGPNGIAKIGRPALAGDQFDSTLDFFYLILS